MQNLESTEKMYKILDKLPTDRDELDEYETNAKELNTILKWLANWMFVKVMQCKTTKHAWEKLKKMHMKGLPNSKNINFKHTKGSSKV